MTRISKASMAAIAMTYAFLVFYISVTFIYVISDNPDHALYGFRASFETGHGMPVQAIPFGSASWIVFVLGTLVSATPTVLCLAILLRILREYYRGEIFTPENARRYRNIGIILVIDALATTTVGESIRILAGTLNNPPGERILSISVGSANVYLLFAGIIMFTVALVMQEASKIHSENQLTV